MDKKVEYLRIYKAADDVLKQPGNPCKIEVAEGVVSCAVSRTTPRSFPSGSMCCSFCKHHDPKVGCTVKSLWCKLGWCYGNEETIIGMKRESHPAFVALSELRKEAGGLGIPMGTRASFEENFR